MSGRHRARKPCLRVTLVTAPARPVWRGVRAGWGCAARTWARLVERAGDRFDSRDPFAHVTLDPQTTTPDPAPAPMAGALNSVEVTLVATPLTPERALTEIPNLPGSPVRWRLRDGVVVGEVDALKLDGDGQRRIVNLYAHGLGGEVTTVEEHDRTIVSTTATFRGVPVTVTAVLAHGDTIPLRVYRESLSTQETQVIPPELVEEVLTR